MSLPVALSELQNRILGRVGGPGVRIVVVAALHGNEPDGVVAVRSILDVLAEHEARLGGSLVALLGNRRAYARGQRYLERDLNRGWDEEPEPEDDTAIERRELREALLTEIEAARAADEPVLVLDLHSTSGPGAPFAIPQPGGASGLAAQALEACGLPQVKGLSERIDNALLSWLHAQGVPCLVMEGGQAAAPGTATCLEAALWRVICHLHGLDCATEPRRPAEAFLVQATAGLPKALEVHYAHYAAAGGGFAMDRPGGQPYRGFQAVARGERLGQDAEGPILAPFDGYLLMPLYQGLGGEGFFLAQELAGG